MKKADDALDSFFLPSIKELGIDKEDRRFFHTLVSCFMLFLGWLYGKIVSRVINKIEVVGKENVPRDVSIIFLSNHYTFIDSFLIGQALYRPWDIVFNFSRICWNLPAVENFYHKPIFRFIFSHSKNIPAIRAKGLPQDKKLKLSQSKKIIELQKNLQKKVLENSSLLYFFGEGRDSFDDQIKECTRSAASLIFHSKPKHIVPILLQDIRQIMPGKKFKFIRGLRCGKRGRIVFGKPVYFDEFYKMPEHEAVLKIAKAATNCVNQLKSVA